MAADPEEEGFESIFFPAEQAHKSGQQIIVAASNGRVRQRIEAPAPHIATQTTDPQEDLSNELLAHHYQSLKPWPKVWLRSDEPDSGGINPGPSSRLLALAQGPKIALITEEQQISYQDLHAISNRVANALTAAGVVAGDRIAMLARDSVASVAMLFGVAKVGAVLVNINWRLAADEIAYILCDAAPRLLFVGDDSRELFLKSWPGWRLPCRSPPWPDGETTLPTPNQI